MASWKPIRLCQSRQEWWGQMTPALQVQSCVPHSVSSACTFLLLVRSCCDFCRLESEGFAVELRSAPGRALGTPVAKSSPSSPSCVCVPRKGQSVIEEWEMHKSREGLKLNSLWSSFLTSLALAQTPALVGWSSRIAMTYSYWSTYWNMQGGKLISKMKMQEYLGCK